MTERSGPPASISEESFYLSLHEVTLSFGVSEDEIIQIVDQAIVIVENEDQTSWQFDHAAIGRIRTALKLQHDLGVNLSGAALAIDLLDEINRLHAQIKNINK